MKDTRPLLRKHSLMGDIDTIESIVILMKKSAYSKDSEAIGKGISPVIALATFLKL